MLKNNLDFKHIDKIIKKGLKNLDYYRVLGIIGESEEPLTSIQILQKYRTKYKHESKNKNHIYEILKELSPTGNDIRGTLLFIWEDLKNLALSQLEEKCHNILQKINQSFDFQIDNHLEENYIVLMDGDSLNLSNKWIIIMLNDKNSKIYNPYFHESILIISYDKLSDKSKIWFYPILPIKKKGKIYVYSKSSTSVQRRQFLNLTYGKQITFIYNPGQKSENNENDNFPKEHKLLEELCVISDSSSFEPQIYLQEWLSKLLTNSKVKNLTKKEKFANKQDYMKIYREKSNELDRLIGDREYFKYGLNFKGLLLFLILYGSIEKDRTDELLFNQVLSNPSLLRIAPFLKNLNEFEKAGFKGKELVVTIAEELKNQLYLAGTSGTILFERAIERYLKEFHEYFKEYEIYFRSQSLKKSVNPDELEEFDKLLKKIYDFRKKMITILIEIIKYKEEYYLDIPDEPIKVQFY